MKECVIILTEYDGGVEIFSVQVARDDIKILIALFREFHTNRIVNHTKIREFLKTQKHKTALNHDAMHIMNVALMFVF